jgi:hypothetical protein
VVFGDVGGSGTPEVALATSERGDEWYAGGRVEVRLVGLGLTVVGAVDLVTALALAFRGGPTSDVWMGAMLGVGLLLFAVAVLARPPEGVSERRIYFAALCLAAFTFTVVGLWQALG